MSIHSYRSTHMIHVPVAVHLRKNKVPEAFTQSLRVFISREKNTTEFYWRRRHSRTSVLPAASSASKALSILTVSYRHENNGVDIHGGAV